MPLKSIQYIKYHYLIYKMMSFGEIILLKNLLKIIAVLK